MKMMAKKRDLSPSEKKAKMDAVHEMRGAASEMMGDKMDGLKKVSVMSNSKQGLAAGLDKAKGIVSQDQEGQMQTNAEAPYSDYKSALDEHNGEDQSDELGRELPGMADGGQVPMDPNQAQSAQDSMRQAFHFNEGGEVESPDMDQSDEGYSAREESDDSEDMSPASDSDSSDLDHNEDSSEDEMSSEELDAQLAKLMKMKQKMESKRS
jgi:hypothetical protein